MDVELSKSLYKWARNKPENKAKLERYLDEALEAIAEGRGKDVQSTSSNGVAVAFSTKGLTVTEWFNTVSKALDFIANPPVNKIRGRVL